MSALKLYWSESENDIVIESDYHTDSVLLRNVVEMERFMHPALMEPPMKSFLKELETRGYDIKTLKIEVKRGI